MKVLEWGSPEAVAGFLTELEERGRVPEAQEQRITAMLRLEKIEDAANSVRARFLLQAFAKGYANTSGGSHGDFMHRKALQEALWKCGMDNAGIAKGVLLVLAQAQAKA